MTTRKQKSGGTGEVDALHESLDAVSAKGLDTVRKLKEANEQETVQ